MLEQLFKLPEDSSSTLQKQIQEMLVKAILDGHIPLGEPLPSGRKLAEQLNVARNTVVFAYQQLVDDGFLVSKERRGHFVNEEILEGRSALSDQRPARNYSEDAIQWNRLVTHPASLRNNLKPDDWQVYEYPFICGQYDKTLFPVADWRECCREAASLSAIYGWASDQVDHDDPDLIEQIHTRILPRRGIWADPEEILITMGAQNAIYLVAALLLDSHKTVGIENPGYFDAINTFQNLAGSIKPLDIDAEGLTVTEALNDCNLVYTTPSHHYPTTVSMSPRRRQDLLQSSRDNNFILLEDDYEPEFNYVGKPSQALKSMDKDGRVIYVSSLSKTLAPGIRLGYMVAHPEFIRQARALRRLMLRHPPSNNQRIIAYFIKRGYHDSAVRRLSQALNERWRIMSAALENYMPGSASKLSYGGSTFWVKGPENLDAEVLAQVARNKGVLIEPGETFYVGGHIPKNYYRLGFSSIPVERIEEGVKIIATLQQELCGANSL